MNVIIIIVYGILLSVVKADVVGVKTSTSILKDIRNIVNHIKLKGKNMSALPKLEKKFKKRWVAALRSGKYNQCAARLYSEISGGYCCLGVAGAIQGVSLNELKYPRYPNQLKDSSLKKYPVQLRDTNLTTEKLAGFNDEGKSFNWIASYIERYL